MPPSRPPARRLPPRCASTWPPAWGTATAATAQTHSISTHPSSPGSKTTRLPARSSLSTSPQTLHPPSPTAPVPSAPTPRSQSSKAAEAPTTPLASPAQSREFYLSPLLTMARRECPDGRRFVLYRTVKYESPVNRQRPNPDRDFVG